MEIPSSVQDVPRLKKRAKAIKTRLNELGVDIKLGHAYEAQAIAMGYADWATMSAHGNRAAPMCSSSDVASPDTAQISHIVESNLAGLMAYEGPVRLGEAISKLAREIYTQIPTLVSAKVSPALINKDHMADFEAAMKESAELIISETIKTEAVRIVERFLPLAFSPVTLACSISAYRYDESSQSWKNLDTTLGELLKEAGASDHDEAYLLIRNHHSYLKNRVEELTDEMRDDMLTMRRLMLIRWCRYENFKVIVSRMIAKT